MNKNKQNIDQFLKQELPSQVFDSNKKSILFSVRIVLNNFLHFSFFSFNIYYFTILLIPCSIIIYHHITEVKGKLLINKEIVEKPIKNNSIEANPLSIAVDSSNSTTNNNSKAIILNKSIPEPDSQIIQKNTSKYKQILKTDTSKIYTKNKALVIDDTTKQTIFEQETQKITKSLNDSLFKDTITNSSSVGNDTLIVIKDTITEVIKSRKRKTRRR